MNVNIHIEEQKRINVEERKRHAIQFPSLHTEPCDGSYVLNQKYLKRSKSQSPNNNDEYIFEFSFRLSDDVKDRLRE